MSDAARRPPKRPWQVWRDRRGRLSALRIATLAVLMFPAVKALVEASAIAHSARPINELIHYDDIRIGSIAMRKDQWSRKVRFYSASHRGCKQDRQVIRCGTRRRSRCAPFA